MPIEQVSSELGRIVSMDAPVEQLADGFGNDNGPAEGPLWWKEGGYLLFSDIGNNRRMKWTAEDGVSVFQEPSNYANGLTRDAQGRPTAVRSGGTRPMRSSTSPLSAPAEWGDGTSPTLRGKMWNSSRA